GIHQIADFRIGATAAELHFAVRKYIHHRCGDQQAAKADVLVERVGLEDVARQVVVVATLQEWIARADPSIEAFEFRPILGLEQAAAIAYLMEAVVLHHLQEHVVRVRLPEVHQHIEIAEIEAVERAAHLQARSIALAAGGEIVECLEDTPEQAATTTEGIVRVRRAALDADGDDVHCVQDLADELPQPVTTGSQKNALPSLFQDAGILEEFLDEQRFTADERDTPDRAARQAVRYLEPFGVGQLV